MDIKRAAGRKALRGTTEDKDFGTVEPRVRGSGRYKT
jgi:hypothetical protein